MPVGVLSVPSYICGVSYLNCDWPHLNVGSFRNGVRTMCPAEAIKASAAFVAQCFDCEQAGRIVAHAQRQARHNYTLTQCLIASICACESPLL